MPNSLRYGDAVHDKAVRNLSVGDVQQRRRWKSADTCLAYIQKDPGRLSYLNFPSGSAGALCEAPEIKKKILCVLRRMRPHAPRRG